MEIYIYKKLTEKLSTSSFICQKMKEWQYNSASTQFLLDENEKGMHSKNEMSHTNTHIHIDFLNLSDL